MRHNQTIQTLSSLLSAALGFDVAIIKRDRLIVAGTGTFQPQIGLHVPRYTIAARNISAYESYVVKNPTDAPECYKCSLRDRCPYSMAIGRPIVSKDKVEGTMILLSTDIEQRKKMAKSIRYLNEHLENISILIANSIMQKQELEFSSGKFGKNVTGLINAFEEGVMVVSKNGGIEYINSAAQNILGCNNKKILITDIDKIPFVTDFKKKLCKFALRTNDYRSEFHIEKRNRAKSIAYSIKRIFNGNKFSGYVVRFNTKIENNCFYSLPDENENGFEKIIGDSFAINTAISEAKIISNAESAVLLLGETGVGKDLFAKAIHQKGGRRNGPFITINCSALPENLLESEMFGYEEGAFSGAKVGGKPGKFELAHNGTLFLDEIGDMPGPLQAKLLRVLEDGMVEKIGSTHPVKVNVRLISATNQNLTEMVEKGTFRKDLFYRISIIPISIPPLRERKDDILLLANHFISEFSKKSGTPIRKLDQTVETLFAQFPWSGNVRELKNTIEYVVQMSQGDWIAVGDLPKPMQELYFSKKASVPNLIHHPCMSELKLMEKKAIAETVKRFDNTTEGKKMAAQHLGISLTTLYRRLKFFDIRY